MNVLSVCMTYPSEAKPWRGAFVKRRLEAMARHMNVRVVSPRHWYEPFAGPGPAQIPSRHPRLLSIPGLLKSTEPWLYSRMIRREIDNHTPHPDLIDAHFEWPDGPAAVRAGRALGLPVVVTLRGKLISHSRYPARRAQMRSMLRHADACIAVSRDLADKAAALADDGRPIHVIPNGIDVARFHCRDLQTARAELGLHPHAVYLVSVGHMQELKGFHRIIELLPRLRATCGDVRLLLIGGPAGERDYENRIASFISSLDLMPWVSCLGRQSPDQTARFLSAADLFVLASRSEGWCNAIHESLACGTPVIATDVGGNRELVGTAGDGRLVPLDDRDALCDAITFGLRNPWSRHDISARASTRTWDDVASEVHAVFSEVLNRQCIPSS